jgi:hypothetical protein
LTTIASGADVERERVRCREVGRPDQALWSLAEGGHERDAEAGSDCCLDAGLLNGLGTDGGRDRVIGERLISPTNRP